MKIRYKSNPEDVRECHKYNIHAIAEVLTGDDSAFTKDLDAFIEKLGVWKDFNEALRDRDIISDNYNQYFFEPQSVVDRARGYTL